MSSKAWVQLALDKLKCNQTELAAHLKVSPTQITKWKKGEHLSSEMKDKFKSIVKIGDRNPEFVLLAGSLENAKKWEKLIAFLAERAVDNAETGYKTEKLAETAEHVCWDTFDTLNEMGVKIPQIFPKDLAFNYQKIYDLKISEEESERLTEIIYDDTYASLIADIYKSLTDLYGFYRAYISELDQQDSLDVFDLTANIEACLMSLAACKIEVDSKLAPNFHIFKRTWLSKYKDWTQELKIKAFSAGMPLRAELMDLVYEDHDSLGHDAEAESLGVNESRLHPDIYMNELLVNTRMIHQVLPKIMKKLEIYDEFTLDESNLHLNNT